MVAPWAVLSLPRSELFLARSGGCGWPGRSGAMVAQAICNRQVAGSNPAFGSTRMEQGSGNREHQGPVLAPWPLFRVPATGGVAERSIAPGCKLGALTGYAG